MTKRFIVHVLRAAKRGVIAEAFPVGRKVGNACIEVGTCSRSNGTIARFTASTGTLLYAYGQGWSFWQF